MTSQVCIAPLQEKLVRCAFDRTTNHNVFLVVMEKGQRDGVRLQGSLFQRQGPRVAELLCCTVAVWATGNDITLSSRSKKSVAGNE